MYVLFTDLLIYLANSLKKAKKEESQLKPYWKGQKNFYHGYRTEEEESPQFHNFVKRSDEISLFLEYHLKVALL